LAASATRTFACHRDAHAHDAGRGARHRADHEACRHPDAERDQQQHGDRRTDHCDSAVLAVQEGSAPSAIAAEISSARGSVAGAERTPM